MSKRFDNKRILYILGGLILLLALSFSGKFNDYRDKSFLSLKKEDSIKISFIFPGDSSFVLSRKDSTWQVNAHKTDSLALANYMNSLRYINGQDIKDNFKPVKNPAYELKIEGNNLLNVAVKCFKSDSDDEFILNSSLNPDVYFASKKDGIYDRLFKSGKYFTTISLIKSYIDRNNP